MPAKHHRRAKLRQLDALLEDLTAGRSRVPRGMRVDPKTKKVYWGGGLMDSVSKVSRGDSQNPQGGSRVG